MAVGERHPERASRAMASIAPTFHGFPLSSIRMSAMLFEREQGDSYDAKRQADELGAGRLFLVDERSDQHSEENTAKRYRPLTANSFPRTFAACSKTRNTRNRANHAGSTTSPSFLLSVLYAGTGGRNII